MEGRRRSVNYHRSRVSPLVSVLYSKVFVLLVPYALKDTDSVQPSAYLLLDIIRENMDHVVVGYTIGGDTHYY